MPTLDGRVKKMAKDHESEIVRQMRIEQANSGLREFATVLRSYHRSLVDSGFSKAEAFQLTVQYQHDMLFGLKSRDKNE